MLLACLGAAAIAAAIVVGGDSEPAQPSTMPAPSSVAVPAGLDRPGVAAEGIGKDGSVAGRGTLSLRGGPLLRVRGTVEAAGSLTVTIDRVDVTEQPLAPGPLDLSVLLPPSSTNRRIELRLGDGGNARLTSIALGRVVDAPAAIRVPRDLASAGVIASGVDADGWTTSRATFALAGGPAGALVVRGQVPPLPNGGTQRLAIRADGVTVADEEVAAGAFALRAPIERSDAARSIELRWSETVRLSAQDPRRRAALLTTVAIADVRGVARLQLPSGLGRAVTSGIYADGWAKRDVRVVLAGGPTAVLRVGLTVPFAGQHVSVTVGGDRVAETTLAAGANSLAVPVGPTEASRLVELHFQRVRPIATNDPRPAAALLQSLSVQSPGTVPAAITIPDDLDVAALAAHGVYADGWAQREVRFLLAGGRATTMTVRAQTILSRQRMTVFVNGRRLGAVKLPAGSDLVNVGVTRSAGPRLVVLRFARAEPISANDPRVATTRLRGVSLGGGTTVAAAAGDAFAASLTTSAVVPPVDGSATGVFTATLNGTTLRWRLTVEGLSGPPFAAVIHSGGEGENGATLVDLCRPCTTSGTGSVQLSAEAAAAVREGNAYVNVGTPAHRYGEIRGQIATRSR